jgi:uncharacterized cupredoxin-like copper-binding protein
MGGANNVRRTLRRAAAYPTVAAALLVVGSCTSGPHADHSAGSTVQVTERDFRISAAPTHVPAGDLVLSVHNRGPVSHELLVVRARATPLPLRADGMTIDEDALEQATVGALEAGSPGAVRRLRVHVTPGRYVIFCNMSGHYLGGMHTELVVS